MERKAYSEKHVLPFSRRIVLVQIPFSIADLRRRAFGFQRVLIWYLNLFSVVGGPYAFATSYIGSSENAGDMILIWACAELMCLMCSTGETEQEERCLFPTKLDFGSINPGVHSLSKLGCILFNCSKLVLDSASGAG